MATRKKPQEKPRQNARRPRSRRPRADHDGQKNQDNQQKVKEEWAALRGASPKQARPTPIAPAEPAAWRSVSAS